ncbi:MAG: CoxG family protein [Pseudomonadota bacterium]
MEFDQDITVSASPEHVWAFLWNIERMARCIPGCQSARTIIAGQRYEASVVERVGPFKVQFPLEIEVVEASAPVRLRARASGRDAGMGSSLQMELDLAIRLMGNQTVLRVHSNVTVAGKLAILGHSMITRKATEIMSQFAQALQRELEQPQADAATV